MQTSQYRTIMVSLKDKKYSPRSPVVKLFSHKRWKNLILKAAENLNEEYPNNSVFISDLHVIGKAIPEEYLIEATIGIKKFKPEFEEQKPFLEPTTVSTLSQTCIKAAKYKTQKTNKQSSPCKQSLMRQKTFHQEFNKKSHPFRFMIKNIRNLLQLKYKNTIDNEQISVYQLQNLLKKDLQISIKFLLCTAQPYKQLFDLKDEEQNEKLCLKFDNFFKCYIENHPKFSQTIHTIILYYCRNRLRSKLDEKIRLNVTPEEYMIPNDFQIDGRYVRAMTSIIEFSNFNGESSSSKILSKLLEFRKNILNDIDEYYLEKDGESKQLEINAEIQIQVIRFIIGKVKDWGVQIYAQLKFLQYVYGQDEIGYKYQQASFMYAQLSIAFQLLGFEDNN